MATKRSAAAAGPSRREFLKGSAAMGGGLVLGFTVPFGAAEAKGAANAAAAPELNAWVVIRPDDTVIVRIARSEMGQGTLTGLAQLVAEELDCDWGKVTTEDVTAGRNLASKRRWGDMSTGGSRGIRASQDSVRRGGATARLMLLQAAADQWKVPVTELATADGVITHAASGRSVSYGKVASAAALLAPPDPKRVTLKDPGTWKVAGQGVKRLDTRPKLDGSLEYAIDTKLPGMLNAAVKACPVFGGRLASYDEAAVRKMPGVKGVVKVDDATVAVVADTWWRAKKALDALPVTWDEGPAAEVTSESILAHLRSGLWSDETYVSRQVGDAPAAIAASAKRVEATYFTPFLSHATMEPMNCTALVTKDRAEVWVPTQNAEASLAACSEVSGLPLDRCEVHRPILGGGFGRRGGNQDYTRQAVAIAKQFPGKPVKMIWSREEDMGHGFYRPISVCRLSAGLDEKGEITGLAVRLAGQSINAWVNPAMVADGRDERQLQGWYEKGADAQLGYTFPSLRMEYSMRNTPVPVGPWRGVNTNQNGIYMECFIEEVARAAGKDSVEFRRRLMKNHPKHLAVLEAAARKAGWGTPPAPGVHRGIAQFMGYASYSAAVAEVTVSPAGEVKVHRMVLALDCGHAVNPAQIAAQVEGSVAFGLSALFYGEHTIDRGRVKELNFDTYRLVKLAQMPRVETVIVPTHDFWGGVGEPTICVVAPAVMNAILAATGKPVRELPARDLKLV